MVFTHRLASSVSPEKISGRAFLTVLVLVVVDMGFVGGGTGLAGGCNSISKLTPLCPVCPGLENSGQPPGPPSKVPSWLEVSRPVTNPTQTGPVLRVQRINKDIYMNLSVTDWTSLSAT